MQNINSDADPADKHVLFVNGNCANVSDENNQNIVD